MDVIIETERLVLRPPMEADLDGWAAFSADPSAMRFLGGPQSRSMAWRALATMAGSWAIKGYGMFSVIERATGRWIGRLGPWQPPEWPGREIAWGLSRAAQGRGYAQEGATAAIDYAIDTLGWPQFIHCIDKENHASIALASKLGSTNTGPGQLPAPFNNDPVNIWSQTAAQWRNRSR